MEKNGSAQNGCVCTWSNQCAKLAQWDDRRRATLPNPRNWKHLCRLEMRSAA